MIILGIKRKSMWFIIAVVLAASIAFNVWGYAENRKLAEKYKSLACMADQFQAGSLISFVASDSTAVNEYKNIEIFDISKGEVVKNLQSNTAIQKEAEAYIERITGLYPRVKAFPDKGCIVRIPLEPPVTAASHWLKDYGINLVNELFVLFPEQGKPYLLILDDKYRPFFYNFEGNTDTLLAELDFNPNTAQ